MGLWPAATVARLVEAQVAADGVYPNAEAVFAAARAADAPAPGAAPTRDVDPAQPHAPDGRWTAGEGGKTTLPTFPFVLASTEEEREAKRELEQSGGKPGESGEEVRPIHPVPRLTEHGPLSNLPAIVPPPKPLAAPPRPDLPATVGPGPFAREGVSAGPSPRASPAQQQEIDRIGQLWGCHRCGTRDPGTIWGHFVADHQPPTALAVEGEQQMLYPHCKSCSDRQGGYVSGIAKRRHHP